MPFDNLDDCKIATKLACDALNNCTEPAFVRLIDPEVDQPGNLENFDCLKEMVFAAYKQGQADASSHRLGNSDADMVTHLQWDSHAETMH